MKGKFEHLFKEVKPEELPEDESEEHLGPCASVPRGRWVTALTIKHAGRWESFQYASIGARSEYEPTRFAVDFVDYPDRYRVVVTGRNLERIYLNCIHARLEWMRAADRDFSADGEPVVTKVEVVKIEEKRG